MGNIEHYIHLSIFYENNILLFIIFNLLGYSKYN